MKLKRVGTSRNTRKPGEEPMEIEAGEDRGREEVGRKKREDERTGRQAGHLTVKATVPSRRISCGQRSLKQRNGVARRTIDLQGRRSFEHNGFT